MKFTHYKINHLGKNLLCNLLSGIYYIHNVVQRPPLSSSKTFHRPQEHCSAAAPHHPTPARPLAVTPPVSQASVRNSGLLTVVPNLAAGLLKHPDTGALRQKGDRREPLASVSLLKISDQVDDGQVTPWNSYQLVLSS